MSANASGNAAQVDYWNARAGETWARLQRLLDRQIGPLGRQAMTALAPAPGERILDVGCGCGETTIDLASRVGPTGEVCGVDISRPMLEVARARPVPEGAAHPDFLEADAATQGFAPGAYDAVYSRFGVMFFDDPEAAFANIRKALRPEGRLAFVCWRPYADNPWMRVPMEAALTHLPGPPPPPDPSLPGPFAFADAAKVERLLKGSGFANARLERFDAAIGGGDLEETLALALQVGPLGGVVRENPHLAEDLSETLKAAFSPYVTPEGVLMPASTWIVTATSASTTP